MNKAFADNDLKVPKVFKDFKETGLPQFCGRPVLQKDSLLRKVRDYFRFLANLKSNPTLTIVLRRLYRLM